ncbi:hypothetical protein PACTADRAFT_3335 [Pachysolen tannophilus NRRL Y-2460]|uniref:Uncharacterized protein n=1 Tax=Pachysolen tannophilus NRRL Y-2460 TaxID=669874 RepID=A0A1E4TV50_PACTA|nr:hypothetical protein PACTADRAFT_3335 [Pachysolen tannophilus NRRL Y-2460]
MNKYDAVVVSDYISIDLVISVLLKTYFNPLYTWFFNLIFYFITRQELIIFLWLPIIIDVIYLILNLNDYFKLKLFGSCKLEKNDNILITGGSRGLGFKIVQNLVKTKLYQNLIILDIKNLNFEPEYMVKNNIHYYYCNLNNVDEVSQLVDKILIKYQEINLLINNAGIKEDSGTGFLNLKLNKFDELINTNLKSHFIILQKIISNSIKNNTKLYVLTISSILAFISPSNLSIYSSTKSSLLLLIESLFYEFYYKENLKFLVILPGQLDTPMFKNKIRKNSFKKQFLSPIIESNKLSLKIIQLLEQGNTGWYFYPFYCNFIPLLKMLPLTIYHFLRLFSEMDKEIFE